MPSLSLNPAVRLEFMDKVPTQIRYVESMIVYDFARGEGNDELEKEIRKFMGSARSGLLLWIDGEMADSGCEDGGSVI